VAIAAKLIPSEKCLEKVLWLAASGLRFAKTLAKTPHFKNWNVLDNCPTMPTESDSTIHSFQSKQTYTEEKRTLLVAYFVCRNAAHGGVRAVGVANE